MNTIQKESPIPLQDRLHNNSELGRGLLNFAEKHGVKIVQTGQCFAHDYCPRSNTAMFASTVSPSEKPLLLAAALRQAHLHLSGAHKHVFRFDPDKWATVSRAYAADLASIMSRVAWEMKLVEDTGPWEYWEKYPGEDIARAVAKEASLDFRSLRNGQAMTAGFEAWFLSERCRKTDHLMIKEALADHRGYIFGKDYVNAPCESLRSFICALGS